jgi:hypothetical protein
MKQLPKKFDHIFYSNYYLDLKNAFGFDKDALENHYLNNGRFENRKYCFLPENFNWKKYIKHNPNIFNTIESNNKDYAITHFLENGSINNELYFDSNNYNDDNNDDNNDNKISSFNEKPIFILYYAFLNNDKDWRHMIKNQIIDMYKSEIMCVSLFHAVLLGSPEDIKDAKSILESTLNMSIQITEVYDNKYEFPAIIKIRELGEQYPDKIFIYIHSKGMVNNNDSRYRTQVEQRLTLNTFLDWESTLYIFEKYPTIQKAAIFTSINGFGWYNFWWARGSYLASCKPIEIPVNLVDNDRFLCETWLGINGSNTWEDCYSIAEKQITYSALPWDDIWTQIEQA